MLWSMGSQRVGHDLATEQVWPLNWSLSLFMTTLCLLFPVFWRFSLSPPMAEVSGSPHTPLYVGKQWTVSLHAHMCKHLCLKERGFPSFLCATVLGELHRHRPRFIQPESGRMARKWDPHLTEPVGATAALLPIRPGCLPLLAQVSEWMTALARGLYPGLSWGRKQRASRMGSGLAGGLRAGGASRMQGAWAHSQIRSK